MKRFLLIAIFFSAVIKVNGQVQSHTMPFFIDGIRGVAVVKTRPYTFGFGGVQIQLESVTFNSAEGLTEFDGQSFPFECKDCRVNVSGNACLDFTGPPYDCTAFTYNNILRTSDWFYPDWPAATKERHDRVRKETGISAWEDKGFISDLQVTGLTGSTYLSLKNKIGKSTGDPEDGNSNDNDNAVASNDPLDQITRDVMRPNTFPSNPRLERERKIREQHEKHVESTRKTSTSNQNQTSGKRQASGPSQEELERRRKAQEWERQRRKMEEDNRKRQEYAQWRDQQNQKNAQVAAATAVGTIGLLAVFGDMIYSGMGTINPDQVYHKKFHGYLGAEFGYSFLLQPVYFNSSEYDGVDYKNNTNYDFNWPINLDMKAKLGFESDYLGGFAFGGMGVGTSIFLHSFNFPTVLYGGQVHAGLPNAKFLFSYEAGERSMSTYYWMFVEESGEGLVDMNWSNLKYGARFSWGDFVRTHLSAGVIYERVGASGDSRVQRIFIENAPQRDDGRFIQGYFLELKKDHSYNFFLNVYPNYPFTGVAEYNIRSDEDYSDGSIYFTVGFHRSLDIFF